MPPGDTGTGGGAAVATNTSYLRDVQPIFERSCFGCHQTGGIAPITFDTPESAQTLGPSLIAAIESKRMPPFYASADCNSYQHDPRLSAAETAMVRAWVDEGGPIGDQAESKHAIIEALPVVRHDVEMSIGADYDVRTTDGSLDNYRCFDLNPNAATDLLVPGYEVTPGNVAVVHHVLAYAVPPEKVAQLQSLDAAAAGPGYPCKSGGVGVDGVIQNQIAGWVPGATATRLPANTALKLAAGSHIVIQIHYNLNALSRAGVTPYDQTHLSLELTPAGTMTTARILPMLKHNLDIKAYDAQSVQTGTLPAGPVRPRHRVFADGPHAPAGHPREAREGRQRRLFCLPGRHSRVGLQLAAHLRAEHAGRAGQQRLAAHHLHVRQLGAAPALHQRCPADAARRDLGRRAASTRCA